MTATCNTCKYFRGSRGTAPRGWCHRFPPQVIYSDTEREPYFEWPEVMPDNWCGEHALRGKEAL